MVNNGPDFKISSNRTERAQSSKVSSPSERKKDFKKILSKQEREGKGHDEKKDIKKEDNEEQVKEEFADAAAKLEAEEKGPAKKGVSLFDLAGVKEQEEVENASKTEGAEELSLQEFPSELLEESLSALFKGYGSKEKLESLQKEIEKKSKDFLTQGNQGKSENSGNLFSLIKKSAANDSRQLLQENAEGSSIPGKTADSLPEKNSASKFSHEQEDLSAVNPLVDAMPQPPLGQIAAVQQTEPTPSRALHLQEIVDQIIDKLYTVSRSGQMDTLIKLKHPPLFAGSTVAITSFKSAKGEFNITFGNLSQAAQQLIEMKQNQDALKLALDQKGYTVHIITATTLPNTTAAVSSERKQEEFGDQGESRGNSQGREEKDEES